MSTLSSAIGVERRSRTSGYAIKKGFFTNETENLPQIIGIFAEGNTANQSNFSIDKREITSSEEAGRIYGYGSPIHQIMRILRPPNASGVGGIPTIVFPQLTSEDSTPTQKVFTISGTATKNAVHNIVINGRENLDFQSYNFSIAKGDSSSIIASKITDAINNVISCPVTAVLAGSTVTLTTKWAGITSNELKAVFNNNFNGAGITYANSSNVQGSGIVNIAPSLEQVSEDWVTCFINSYGEIFFDELEQLNGTPSVETPTGRYDATVFKPFFSFFGSLESDKDVLADITDNEDRIDQVTHVLCPAPKSAGFTWESAANIAYLFSRKMQDSPESDINGMGYPDMPSPEDKIIGDMSKYNNRDFLIKKGCSTVTLEKGNYIVQDLVTTYHPQGETPLQYNYCRNLNLDWNVSDAYRITEKSKLKDKVLINDDQITDSKNAIKPKEWKAILYDLFERLAKKALINEPEFSKESLEIQISATNPNRFETFFRYKRTGIARIESTTVEAGF